MYIREYIICGIHHSSFIIHWAYQSCCGMGHLPWRVALHWLAVAADRRCGCRQFQFPVSWRHTELPPCLPASDWHLSPLTTHPYTDTGCQQFCISACSQLIAAQPQLIACYAWRHSIRQPSGGKGGRRGGVGECLLATLLLWAPWGHISYRQPGRSSVMPFACLRFQLSLDVLWLWCTHTLTHTHTHTHMLGVCVWHFDAVICVNALVEYARLCLVRFDRHSLFFLRCVYATSHRGNARWTKPITITCFNVRNLCSHLLPVAKNTTYSVCVCVCAIFWNFFDKSQMSSTLLTAAAGALDARQRQL